MSRLSHDLASTARRIAAVLRPPAIARVVVPPAEPVADKYGGFCAVQLADGSTGIAYVALGEVRQRATAPATDAIVGSSVASIAERLTQADLVGRSLALASINALTRHLFTRARFEPDFATNSLGSLALGPEDRLGMVGFFPPLVRRAQEQGIPLTVVELRSELVQDVPGLTVTLDPKRLADCTRIVSTSTTLLNDTLDELLTHARNAREIVLIGPSAGCVPDPLFARGVTGVGGAWVNDPEAFMDRASRGEPWGDSTRKYALRNDASWPGLEELLRRARQ